MCNPMVFTVASAVVSAVGSYVGYRQQAQAAQASAKYNKAIAEDQARVNQSLAQQEISKGEADRQRLLRSGMREQGNLASLLGSSGFEIESGSSLSLLAEGAQEIQYDANITTQNAAFAAWQHQANANKALNEAGFYDYQYKSSKGSALAQGLGVAGSLLGGIGQGMSQNNSLNKS